MKGNCQLLCYRCLEYNYCNYSARVGISPKPSSRPEQLLKIIETFSGEALMNEMILASWQRVAAGNHEVDLLSMYKGMPVIYKARVSFVYEDAVHVQPYTFKSVCLTLSKKIIVLSDLLDEPINADVKTVDLPAETAVLENFSYVSGHLGDRMSPRVEPRDPLEIQLESGGRSFTGRVVDLSISGAGVFVSGEEVKRLRSRSVVRFSLPLPGETLQLLGVIRHVRRTTQGSRLGIAFEPGVNLREVFSYINQRRAELLSELEDAYQEALRDRRTGNAEST